MTRFGTGNTVFYVALLNHGWNHQFFGVRLNLGWGHHKDPVIHNVITLVTLGYLFYVLSCSLVTSRTKSDDARPFDKKVNFSQYRDFSVYQHTGQTDGLWIYILKSFEWSENGFERRGVTIKYRDWSVWLDMTDKLALSQPMLFWRIRGGHFKIVVKSCPSQGPKFHGQFDIMHELISKCIQIQL